MPSLPTLDGHVYFFLCLLPVGLYANTSNHVCVSLPLFYPKGANYPPCSLSCFIPFSRIFWSSFHISTESASSLLIFFTAAGGVLEAACSGSELLNGGKLREPRTSRWSTETGHGGSICTTGTGTCKSGRPLSESCVVNAYAFPPADGWSKV